MWLMCLCELRMMYDIWLITDHGEGEPTKQNDDEGQSFSGEGTKNACRSVCQQQQQQQA